MALKDIRGQDTAIQMLKNCIINKHVSHAYLFQGPEGVGKKAVALAFAQALNCLDLQTDQSLPVLSWSEIDGCGCCLSCRKAQKGNHPDIHVIEPEKYTIKIEQIRKLRGSVFYKCYEGLYKVIIIDGAHYMTIEAANSLLKVLEEPPENTVFILVSSEPGKLPDTIISRCQQIQFQPLSTHIIEELLKDNRPEQGGDLALAAGLAGGSLAKARELLEGGEILIQRQETLEFIQKVWERSWSEIILWCEKWDKEKQKVKNILEILGFWYRDLLVYRTTGREEILINQDYLADIKRCTLSLTKINNALLLINKSIKQLEYNVSPRLTLEVFFMNLKIN
ncbi:MAG: DNA polymerase III subunit delta' [Clostridia bacterium]|nr:DNA polymerase III subunit delta' [Clostridia bacterium]